MKLDYAKALTSINEFGKIDLTSKRIKFEKPTLTDLVVTQKKINDYTTFLTIL
jgi:hypothetical protein